MASNATTTVVLTQPEDWVAWYRQLKANIDDQVWKYIDPDIDEDHEPPEYPEKPEFSDFDQNARTYAQLNAGNQRAYDAARRYYEADLKEYTELAK